MAKKKKIIIGVTGASGIILAMRLLDQLRDYETHLIISENAKCVSQNESINIKTLEKKASFVYSNRDFNVPFASGTFLDTNMIVIPCSMKTLASISTGMSTCLISRSADVILKERRKLILVTRETPLNRIHLKNMLEVTDAGAIIVPPCVAFYHKPQNIDEIVDNIVGKCLNLLEIEQNICKSWMER